MARSQSRWFSRCMTSVGVIASALCASGAPSQAITYTDAAGDPTTGISYRRAASVTKAIFDTVKALPFLSRLELNRVPDKSEGAPGVALVDYDMDGDDDIYATNGPGRGNSLYKNMWRETGALTFTDVAAAAGVAATSQDSTGVCYGDIDNDSDPDILVLGRMEASRLFRNEGNGTFTDISAAAGVALEARGHTSCAMGDVDGDGLLDIFIANTYDWVNRAAIYTQSFAFNHANQLYINRGGNLFEEQTGVAGLMELFNVPAGNGTISWAAAMVDIDLDGDLDIIHGDDQAAMPSAGFAGVDRGFQQLFLNDGTGHFTNATLAAGLNQVGAWMGLSFGDVNYDGRMDIWGSNAGDYIVPQFGFPVPPGIYSSRWFVQDAPGHFMSPTLATFGPTVFGWGTGMTDYDNDGDTDIIFYGALDATPFVTADNPGMVLSNDGAGNFSWDRAATASSAGFVLRQIVQGVAIGDLNGDGFTDMVHISSAYHAPDKIPLIPAHARWGTPIDSTAFILPTFFPIGPIEWEWTHAPVEEGFLGVQVNSADNGNRWIKVSVRGSTGSTSGGVVNRDGIGAVVKATPAGSSKQSMAPVLGGSSYASQHSMVQSFGLGGAATGTVEVFWPGGVKNRLYDVAASEHVLMPEVPCDFAGSSSRKAFRTCVDRALHDLVAGDIITRDHSTRLRQSALRAYDEVH
jgi:enediyne biosynthesis protein E4